MAIIMLILNNYLAFSHSVAISDGLYDFGDLLLHMSGQSDEICS